MSFKAGSTIARASSGSRSSISSIEPLMSANRAVTVLRSPSMGVWESTCAAIRTEGGEGALAGSRRPGGAFSGAAHSPQNLAVGAFSKPQDAQRRLKGAAHSLQNLRPSGFSALQLEQRIFLFRLLRREFVEQRLRVFQISGIEALGEPAVDRRQHRARFVAATGIARPSREADGRAQLERFRA